MDEEEYNKKYINLRILKSIQEYLKPPGNSPTALYPIKVPDDLVYRIFRMGLTAWSEKLYNEIFGTQQSLEEFIELVKKRNRE
jgi:hypothetical protein